MYLSWRGTKLNQLFQSCHSVMPKTPNPPAGGVYEKKGPVKKKCLLIFLNFLYILCLRFLYPM